MVSTRNFTLARVSDIMRMCLERIWGQQEGFQEHFISLASSPPGPHPSYHAIEQQEEPQYSISLTHLFVVPPTLQGLPHLLTNCGRLSPLELQDGEARDPHCQPRTQRSS